MPHVRAVQVADNHGVPFRPVPFADQASQRTQPLDEVQGEREHSFGDRACSAARGYHDRDSTRTGRSKVDEVNADAGAGHYAQPGRLLEQGLVHYRIGPVDGTHSDSEVVRGWFGQKGDATAENSVDECRVHRAEGNDDRTIGAHSDSPPNVAPGTVGTCCQVPFSAESAAAAITSATW
jgi:hypothetical protein